MLNKIIYTIFGIGLALVFFPHAAKDSVKKPSVSGISVQAKSQEFKSAPEMALNFPPPPLTVKAALAYDLDSGTILYSNNLDEKLPIASLTKLMTALTVVKNQNLEATITVAHDAQGVVGSTIGLVAGEQVRASDLVRALLISSSNDAAVALADFIGGSQEKFADMMNQQAASLGLVETHFSNPVGWDSYDSQDNYSNALDLIKIVQEFLKNDELRQIVKIKALTITSTDGKYSHELHTTNKLLLDDPEVEGIKTGFTSKALGNLIILVNHADRRIVTVVLGSNNREQDSRNLIDWVLSVYRW